jgi:amino acid adenylation domain-containing protein
VAFPEEDLEQSIPARFEAQAFRHPFRLAVKTETATLTYRELNRQANRLARAIRALCGSGVQPIAYLTDDDVKSVVANMAILKSGNPYVSLDPHYPQARTMEVLEDSQAALIVTDQKNLEAAEAMSRDVKPLNMDALPRELSTENLEESVPADALARIIYTSGSTGQPKGVVSNHRSILMTALNVTNSLRLGPSDHIALFSARSSAQGIAITYSALLNGARLCPFPIRQEGLDRLAGWLMREEITIYHSNAAIFGHFMRTLTGEEQFPCIRVVKLGGDPVSRRELDLFKRHFSPGCLFVNALSSTEGGTFRQYVADHRTEMRDQVVPVGHALFGTEVLLLDDSGRPVAPGQAGEIAVRGRCLAQGYWRKPEMTRARFLTHGDERIYLTGDLGRMGSDGCLHHLGRKDFQLKIRGNRVEPAEVEMALRELEAVSQAVVVARKDGRGDPYLAAYIVPAKEAQLQVTELRGALRKKLPDYMIPSAFVMLDSLPLSPQGKIDRQALPEPPVERNYLPPQNPVEAKLVEIWEEVLGVHPIGVLDDFFALGGDSLNAVCVVNRIEESFGKHLPAWTFFDAPKVQEMAQAIAGELKSVARSPLLNAAPSRSQRPLFFLHGQYNGEGFYCLRLARFLGEQVPMYALQPLGPPGALPETIESAAAHYVKALREAQPHGPYLLGGYCNGGIIAFEMAQQLRAQGEKVERLVIIEGVARNTEFRMRHRLARWIGRIFGLDGRTQLDLFVRLRSLGEGFWAASGLERAKIAGRKVARILSGRSNALRQIGRFLCGKRPAEAHESAAAATPASADWNKIAEQRTGVYHRVLTGYVAHRYPGRITVFRAADRNIPAPSEALGWDRVTKELDLRLIPGDHDSCVLKPENLAVLAEYLKSCLSQKFNGGKAEAGLPAQICCAGD